MVHLPIVPSTSEIGPNEELNKPDVSKEKTKMKKKSSLRTSAKRLDVLEEIRNERKRYNDAKLKLMKEYFEKKIEIENKKLAERIRKNDLISERNSILKKKC